MFSAEFAKRWDGAVGEVDSTAGFRGSHASLLLTGAHGIQSVGRCVVFAQVGRGEEAVDAALFGRLLRRFEIRPQVAWICGVRRSRIAAVTVSGVWAEVYGTRTESLGSLGWPRWSLLAQQRLTCSVRSAGPLKRLRHLR